MIVSSAHETAIYKTCVATGGLLQDLLATRLFGQHPLAVRCDVKSSLCVAFLERLIS